MRYHARSLGELAPGHASSPRAGFAGSPSATRLMHLTSGARRSTTPISWPFRLGAAPREDRPVAQVPEHVRGSHALRHQVRLLRHGQLPSRLLGVQLQRRPGVGRAACGPSRTSCSPTSRSPPATSRRRSRTTQAPAPTGVDALFRTRRTRSIRRRSSGIPWRSPALSPSASTTCRARSSAPSSTSSTWRGATGPVERHRRLGTHLGERRLLLQARDHDRSGFQEAHHAEVEGGARPRASFRNTLPRFPLGTPKEQMTFPR